MQQNIVVTVMLIILLQIHSYENLTISAYNQNPIVVNENRLQIILDNNAQLYDTFEIVTNADFDAPINDSIGIILFFSIDNSTWFQQIMQKNKEINPTSWSYFTSILLNETGYRYLYVQAIFNSNILATSILETVYVSNGVLFDISITPSEPTRFDIVKIKAVIRGQNLINESAIIYYKYQPPYNWENIKLNFNDENNLFSIDIGPFQSTTAVDYYIQIMNSSTYLFNSTDEYFSIKSGITTSNTDDSGLTLLPRETYIIIGIVIIISLLVFREFRNRRKKINN